MPFYATRSALWISGLATLLLTVVMIVVFAPLGEKGGIEIVALQFSFTPDRFAAIVARWGDDGVALFRSRMWLDYLYPTAYSFLLAGLLFRKSGKGTFVWVPFLAGLFDFIENTIHLKILGKPNLFSPLFAFSPSLVLLASLLATVKWMGILGSLGILLCPMRR